MKKESTHQTNKDRFPESDDEVKGSSYSCKDIRIKKDSTHQRNKDRFPESDDEVYTTNMHVMGKWPMVLYNFPLLLI